MRTFDGQNHVRSIAGGPGRDLELRGRGARKPGAPRRRVGDSRLMTPARSVIGAPAVPLSAYVEWRVHPSGAPPGAVDHASVRVVMLGGQSIFAWEQPERGSRPDGPATHDWFTSQAPPLVQAAVDRLEEALRSPGVGGALGGGGSNRSLRSGEVRIEVIDAIGAPTKSVIVKAAAMSTDLAAVQAAARSVLEASPVSSGAGVSLRRG